MTYPNITAREAKAIGDDYLAWLKANKLRDSTARFVAFCAGWSLCGSFVAKMKLGK